MIHVKRFLTVLSIAFTVLSLNTAAYAQSTANGFRISPIRNELTVEKGKSQTVQIALENPSNLPLKAKALINDFVASDKEDGQPLLLLDGKSAPSHSFKKLAQEIPEVDLAPNERKYVNVTVTVPVDAAAGGYYGAVRFIPADAKASANVSLTASVGSLFLINVPGNVKEHLQLIEFTAAVNGKAKKLIFGGQVSIITRLKNDGDTHEKPYGKIQVKDSHNKLVAEEEINNIDPQSNILPTSIRKFETKLKNTKWLGHYTVTASYGYNPSTDSPLINAKTSFWYVPVWLAVVLVILLIAVLVAAYLVFRKVSARSSRKHHKN
jgi:Bacterial protein of unknown function (DUF916)